MQKIYENAHYNFQDSQTKVMFCLPENKKTQNIKFIIIWNRVKQQILTFERLEPVDVWVFEWAIEIKIVYY